VNGKNEAAREKKTESKGLVGAYGAREKKRSEKQRGEEDI